jgi:hypothetical protein
MVKDIKRVNGRPARRRKKEGRDRTERTYVSRKAKPKLQGQRC